MPKRIDVIARAHAALNSTNDPHIRYGITLLRDALANGDVAYFVNEVERTAQGLIVLCEDPRERLGIAVLSHMMGVTVLPVPIIRIETTCSQPPALPYDAVVTIDAPHTPRSIP